MTLMVENLSAVQEAWVLGEGNGNSLQYSCLENPMNRADVDYSPWDHKESDTTERLTLTFTFLSSPIIPKHYHS